MTLGAQGLTSAGGGCFSLSSSTPKAVGTLVCFPMLPTYVNTVSLGGDPMWQLPQEWGGCLVMGYPFIHSKTSTPIPLSMFLQRRRKRNELPSSLQDVSLARQSVADLVIQSSSSDPLQILPTTKSVYKVYITTNVDTYSILQNVSHIDVCKT